MLIKENVNKYVDIRLDYNFIDDNEFNSDIGYYNHDKDVCKKMKNLIKTSIENQESIYSKFGLYCLSRFVSYNEALKLYNNGYILDFDKIEKYRGYGDTIYYQFKNIYWTDKLNFEDLKPKFILYKYNAYEYSEDTLDVDYDVSLLTCEDFDHKNYFDNDKKKQILGPNIYMVMQWLIKNDKLTIIDKGNYFMFFFNNQKEFHLCRTKDHDVYFRENDFEDAINTIFEKLL